MNKSRIFATVIYFIFTFGIGILFAVTLPGYFATFTIPTDIVYEALHSDDFVTALALTEPVGFKRDPVLDCKFDWGGVILFEAVMEVPAEENSDEDSTKPTPGTLYKCYEGFVYGAEGFYDVTATKDNGTLLKVTTESGVKDLPLLDFDSDGNGSLDGISTFTQSGFIVLEIRESDVSSVRELTFLDKDGKVSFTASPKETLSFESTFYDAFGDIEEYNGWVKTGTATGVTESARKEAIEKRNAYVEGVIQKLDGLEGCEVTTQSEEYQGARDAISGRANKKAIPFIIIYFVAIYIIADFLLGTHFIIKFFKWFLFKVCKLGGKKRAENKDEVFGHDYYSMVTLSLDISEVPDFNGSVSIKYTGDGEEYVFTLLRAENYSTMLRMKAGVYVNPFIEIDRAYGPVDLPENLEVEGYQTTKIIKIVKREEQRL